MRTFSFLFITLVSGATAGAILGLINLAVVEPFIDQAIGIELNNDINAGQSENMVKRGYDMAKGGEVVGGILWYFFILIIWDRVCLFKKIITRQ